MKLYTKVAGILVTLASAVGPVWGLTLRVQGTNAFPGDTPDVCVFLDNNDGTVSGLQVDLVWDSSCLSVDRSTGDQAACVMNPETGRSTFQTRVLASDRMRALLLSLNDTSPMPRTVNQLFCCQFRVSAAAGGRTCGVNLTNVILSDPKGQRLQSTGVGGSIVVARARDERGVGTGGVGTGAGVAAPAVSGGSGGVATGESEPSGAPVAPGGPGAAGPAPAGAPPAPVGVPAQAPPAPAVNVPAEAAVEGEMTPEPTVQSTPGRTPKATKPTPAATPPTKATPAGTPPKADTPNTGTEKTPTAGTPLPGAEARTPRTKQGHGKTPRPS